MVTGTNGITAALNNAEIAATARAAIASGHNAAQVAEAVVAEALQRWEERFPFRPSGNMTCTASLFH